MTTTKQDRFDIGCDVCDLQPHTIRVLDKDGNEWMLTSKKDDEHQTHDPMDRVGGPYCIHRLCADGAGSFYHDHWFLFFIGGSYFPPCILVRGINEQKAYDNFVDWLGDKDCNDGNGNYGMIVSDEDMAEKEKEENLDGISFTSYGVPVDTSDIRSRPCTIKALEF